MSNKPKSKTNITKITARSHREASTHQPQNEPAQPQATTPEAAAGQPTGKILAGKAEKTAPAENSRNNAQKIQKGHKNRKDRKDQAEKPLKEIFVLARPFVALGRYLRDSWRELRQVRWPNRKATWKMTLAGLVNCAIFIAFITLLDTLFTFIFKVLLGN